MIQFPIGIITDTHLHKNNIDLVKHVMDQFMLDCMEIGIKTVIHCGDVFDERPQMPIEVYLAWRSIIQRFWFNGICMYVIPGNHDKQDQTQNESHLTLFERYTGFNLIDSFHAFADNKTEFVFLPYFPVKYQINKLDTDKYYGTEYDKRILFIHAAINGAKNNNGSIVDNGIPQELLESFDLVISGHYHNRRKVGANIWYMGSAYQANFGEDKNKGYAVLHEDLKLEFFPLDFPKYLTYPVYIDHIKKREFDDIFKYIQQNPHDKIRVKLGAPYEEQDFSLIDELNDLGIRCEYPEPKIEKQTYNFKQLNKQDIIKIFKNFVNLYKDKITKPVQTIMEKYI